jgi:hypothetical protein
MFTFMTIAGLIIAFIFFLYTLSVVDSGKRKIKDLAAVVTSDRKSESTKDMRDKETGATYRNLPDNIKDMIPGRRCPLCLKTLTRDEPLYASFVETTSGRKVLIYGCQYCYKEEPSKKTSHRDEPAVMKH